MNIYVNLIFLFLLFLQDIFEVLMYEIFPELQHKQCSLTK